MNIVVAFLQRLFTSILSIFDIVSDLVNSCDFLGYDASGQIFTSIFGDKSCITRLNNISTFYPSNQNLSHTSSKLCGFNFTSNETIVDGDNSTLRVNYTFHETIVNGDNSTLRYEAVEEFKNFSSCLEQRATIHVIWGSLGIGIMFLPGIMTIVMAYATIDHYSVNEDLSIKDGPIWKRMRNLIAMFIFPITVILLQIYGVFISGNTAVQGFMAIGIALEAFLESFLQLVLQLYTICYGYDITTTQIITICASFVLLSKASIDLDLEMYEHKLTFKYILIHYLKTAPGYCATIAFRAFAFSITLAFLRVWSLIPMCLLMVELIVAYRIAFETFGSFDGAVDSPFLPMMITNLGVTNVGMIGACGYMRSNSKEEGKYVYEYLGKTNVFIKLSSIASFLHHATVLTTILGIVIHDPNYFEHWASRTFILQNYDQFFHENVYYMYCGAIVIGYIGLLSSHRLGAKGMKIAIDQNIRINSDRRKQMEEETSIE